MSGWVTMRRILQLMPVLWLLLIPAYVQAEKQESPALTAGEKEARHEQSQQVDAASELPKMQKILDKIKGQVSSEKNNDSDLKQLNDYTLELANNASTLSQALLVQRSQVTDQLEVFGPAPTAETQVQETVEVTRKRRALEAEQKKITEQLKHSETIKNSAFTLSSRIINLRRDRIKDQLSLNSGSILSASFWSPVWKPKQEDIDKGEVFSQQVREMLVLAVEPEWRTGTIVWLIAAFMIMVPGRRYAENFLAWISIHKLPDGRLRRSFLAAAIALTTLMAVFLSMNSVVAALARHAGVSAEIKEFVDQLVPTGVTCGLIAGLGRAFLSTRRPSWRLPPLSNEVAQALKFFPLVTAVLVFLFQAVETLNRTLNSSVDNTILANGLTALLIGGMALLIGFRASYARRKQARSEQHPATDSVMTPILQIILILSGLLIYVTLLVGYIPLARFFSYELIWIAIVLGNFYLLNHLIPDLFDSLFSTNNPSGKRIRTLLNLEDRHLAQASVLLSGLSKTMLLLLAIAALLNGTFGASTPIELLQKGLEFWGGKGLETLNIVPAQVVNALICLVIGVYIMRTVKHWLNHRFLPQTSMDDGMRASLVALFSHIGYVLVVLLTLAMMGLQWNKLAWIVSALSVGIGFGLQEIVKNFISGLILLTERPVKVGDLITISGIEGDIRRINIRATEIQLGDKSTVIVPNSQLISQNVRNATMGNAQGVVTITLTLPLETDPEKVKGILLTVFRSHERMLTTPEPSVAFKDLTSQGIVLSVTGHVSSQRIISGVKSDLLFTLLSQLREEGVILSSAPQTVVLERPVKAHTK